MRKPFVLFVILAIALTSFATDRLSTLPSPILGGELSNSAATSVADIDEVMPRMKALGLNTVLVPAYWELMEIASCFSDNVLQADLKAFSALMRHIREKDPQREVVIMMQIENEIGMLESARDQTHQGRHARIGVGEWKILHIKLYEY